MRRARWSGQLFLLALAALVIAGTTSKKSGTTAQAAPPLPREVLSGHRVSLTSLHGRPALVNFWASPQGDTGRAYGVGGLPVTYGLDADGWVVETLRGPQTLTSLSRAARRAAR